MMVNYIMMLLKTSSYACVHSKKPFNSSFHLNMAEHLIALQMPREQL